MIIDRWYADYLAGKNTYHDDNGEGCDCYKVGRTLGAGAMAPYVNDSLWLGITLKAMKHLTTVPFEQHSGLNTRHSLFVTNGNGNTHILLDAGSQIRRSRRSIQGWKRISRLQQAS